MQLTTLPEVERTEERCLEVFDNTRIVMEAKRLSPSTGEVFHRWMEEHGSLFIVKRE